MTSARAVEIPADLARHWVRQSLGGGHAISAAVLANLQFEDGIFRALLPQELEPGQVPDFEYGGIVKQAVSEAALARVLEELARRGAACVVVEDDLSIRTDPAVEQSSEPLAFIGDRVISWCNLDPGAGVAAAEIVGQVGSGFPTNAFVVSRSAADLGLADRRLLSKNFGSKVVECLMAVVVAAYDDESYVLWTES